MNGREWFPGFPIPLPFIPCLSSVVFFAIFVFFCGRWRCWFVETLLSPLACKLRSRGCESAHYPPAEFEPTHVGCYDSRVATLKSPARDSLPQHPSIVDPVPGTCR